MRSGSRGMKILMSGMQGLYIEGNEEDEYENESE